MSSSAFIALALPPKRITINLSPADLPKEGSHYDLPIALALLAAMGVTDAEHLTEFITVGELALDARIVPSPGVLLAAIFARGEDASLICPRGQGATRPMMIREDGSLTGPFDAWLRTPILGEHFERAGMAFRTDTTLSAAPREIAGRTRCARVPRPETGSQPSSTAK